MNRNAVVRYCTIIQLIGISGLLTTGLIIRVNANDAGFAGFHQDGVCIATTVAAVAPDSSSSRQKPPPPTAPQAASAWKAFFPRLLGMNIGAKNYDDPEYQRQLARLDVVVLGFYKGWKPAYGVTKVVQNLKELSGGKILVGQYTVMNECVDNPKNKANLDVQNKLHEMNWWARKADGNRVQWTTQYNAWDINFTAWTKADAGGLRYPQWLAEYDNRFLFESVPFDFWYCDNVFGKPRVTADWDGDGKDDSAKDPAVAAVYRNGHCAEWTHIRKIHPSLLLMGNADNDLAAPEYAGQLEGAFLEALMGKKWSIEAQHGWAAAMQRYRDALKNTRAPHMVGFNVHGNANDYRFFRYAYGSCLLDDGLFSFSALDKGYSSVPWFDEYDIKLGKAVAKPPGVEWKDGVWRRDFENGIVLVNPTKQLVTVTLDPGFQRLTGTQDARVNNGTPVTTITIASKDGLILKRK